LNQGEVLFLLDTCQQLEIDYRFVLGACLLPHFSTFKIQTIAAKGDPSFQDGTAPSLCAGCREFGVFQTQGKSQDLKRRKRNQKEDDLWPI